jgi:hypothetical protein
VVTTCKVMQPHPNRRMRKAVYFTCRDADIAVEAGAVSGARARDFWAESLRGAICYEQRD